MNVGYDTLATIFRAAASSAAGDGAGFTGTACAESTDGAKSIRAGRKRIALEKVVGWPTAEIGRAVL
jgi:hypothetical protein